jgi:dihydrofolate synthase/folylpolyglutamate synthase
VTLENFLDRKPLYYKEIDYERVHIAYGMLKSHIRQPRTVQVVGTNGKGSTGRILAHLAYQNDLSVGHYTSPHIMKFNERIWLNGKDASDEVLEVAHQRLYTVLGQEMSDALSYFEYTTLLAFIVFENCDLMVLEAGLGGEYDATSVCDKELSIITPIGLDHQAFLGESIEKIATTKIKSIQKKALLAPQPYPEVIEVAKKIAEEKGAELFFSAEQDNCRSGYPYPDINEGIDESVGVGAPRPTELRKIAQDKGWAGYLIDNTMVALQALEILGIGYDINMLADLELFGRFYPIKENIRIDVGHNPLAAQAIVKAMEPETVLIYNSLDDKDYEAVLQALKHKVKRVEIIQIDSQRATTLDEIEKALQNVGLEYSYFNGIIDEDERYLVFGSFYVVEEFLKNMEYNVSK